MLSSGHIMATTAAMVTCTRLAQSQASQNSDIDDLQIPTPYQAATGTW